MMMMNMIVKTMMMEEMIKVLGAETCQFSYSSFIGPSKSKNARHYSEMAYLQIFRQKILIIQLAWLTIFCIHLTFLYLLFIHES